MFPALARLETRYRRMRGSTPGQSALLMADVADSLAGRGVRYAVIAADAIVALQVREAQTSRQFLLE